MIRAISMYNTDVLRVCLFVLSSRIICGTVRFGKKPSDLALLERDERHLLDGEGNECGTDKRMVSDVTRPDFVRRVDV